MIYPLSQRFQSMKSVPGTVPAKPGTGSVASAVPGCPAPRTGYPVPRAAPRGQHRGA